MMSDIPVLILAAGASTRMGEPKQLLLYQDKTLLQHAIDTAKEAGSNPIIVVLGAFYDEIYPSIQREVIILRNEKWEEGMATSLNTGVSHIMKHLPKVPAILCMLCDQPLITPEHLRRLKEKWKTGDKPIIATQYNDIQGVPVLFDQVYFEKLSQMQGATGARKLLKIYQKDVNAISFEKAAQDIDTPEAYNKLIKGE